MTDKGLFHPRRISRRNALALVGGGLAAKGLTAPLPLRAETPRRGGHMVFGVSQGGAGDSLDPRSYNNYGMYTMGATLCNYLVELDSKKNPVPELATGWAVSDGARKWVFDLRDGVEFHNGKTFTAEDAVYSLNLHRGEDTNSSAKSLLAGVSDIRADGPLRLVIELSDGNAEMPAILASSQFAIVPAGFDDWPNLVGTGGYRIETFDPGVRAVTSRNPNYWKDGRAWFDSYEQLVITDPGTRVNALITGEVLGVDRTDIKVVNQIARVPHLYIVENRGSRYQSAAMDSRVAPFDSLDVRLAMKYAVDRDEFLRKINRGYGALGNDQPVPPNDPFFNAAIPQRVYDPDRARFHLKQAGLDGIAIDLSASDAAYPGAVDAAALYKERAAPAGIDITVVREPNDGYWSNVWLKKPMMMVNWGVRATPTIHFALAYACGAPWADGFYCNERFESLLKQAKVETDQDRRKEILGEMQEIQVDLGSNIVFSFVSFLDGYNTKVKGGAEDAAGAMMGTRLAERLWMEG